MIVESKVLEILREYNQQADLNSVFDKGSLKLRSDGWDMLLEDLTKAFPLSDHPGRVHYAEAEGMSVQSLCEQIRLRLSCQPMEDKIYQTIISKITSDVEPSTELNTLDNKVLTSIGRVIFSEYGVSVELNVLDGELEDLEFVCKYVNYTLCFNNKIIDTSDTELPVSLTKEGELTEIEGPEIGAIARVIVDYKGPCTPEGHSLLKAAKKFSMGELKELMTELDSYYYSKMGFHHSVYASIESDGSGELLIRDYWQGSYFQEEGDKVIFSFYGG